MCYLIYCVDLWCIWSLNSDLSRHTFLDISRRFIFIFSLFDQLIRQKLCVCWLAVLIVCPFSNWKVIHGYTVLAVSLRLILCFSWFYQWKSRHYVLANLPCLYGVLLVIENWFKKTQYVNCFTNIFLGYFTIIPMGKAYTMCYLIYCVGLG